MDRKISDWDELSKIISGIKEPESLKLFFKEILTEKERNDIILRWELMKRLKEGIPHRNIASDLKISLCKITRGSKIIKDPNSIISKIIDNLS